jgi:DNA polymerase-3 subunit delta'
MMILQTWQELKQQQPLVVNMITNSIKRGRLSHAYLLQGSRGTGKSKIASLLAMTLFCKSRQGIEPCQTCATCRRIQTGNHPDVHWVEREGQSIKNEQIKALRKEFAYTGYESTKKVYIISSVETLTVNAANRILKFLEEPDIETTAILLTDNVQGVLPTIRSRCQILDLKPLEETAFQHRLVGLTEHSISEGNAKVLSALTNNMDEAIQFHKEEKVYHIRDMVQEFIDVLVSCHQERYLFLHQKWFPLLKEKKEQEQGLELLLLAFKDMINYQIGREDKILLFEHKKDGLLGRAASHFTQGEILAMTKQVLDARRKLTQNIHPTLLMEQLVLQF